MPDGPTWEAQTRCLAKTALGVPISADYRHLTWAGHVTYQAKPTALRPAYKDTAYNNGLRDRLASAESSLHRYLVDPEREATESDETECYLLDDTGTHHITPAEFYADGDREEWLLDSLDTPAIRVIRTDVPDALTPVDNSTKIC
jgi:hypothetical protein